MNNMRAIVQLGKRTGEEAAVDALLEQRPMLLQLQVDNWLQFLSAYGVRVGSHAACMGFGIVFLDLWRGVWFTCSLHGCGVGYAGFVACAAKRACKLVARDGWHVLICEDVCFAGAAV